MENSMEEFSVETVNKQLFNETTERENDATEAETLTSARGAKRRAFDVKFKLEVIKYAKQNSNQGAAKHFGVSRSSIQDWRKQEELLKQLENGKRKRVDGAGRHLMAPEVDTALAIWIRAQRAEKKLITRRIITSQAIKMFKRAECELKTSHGWLEKFLQRHGFALRAATTQCQKLPSEYDQTIVNFLLYLAKIRADNDYKRIFACDQTAVWINSTNSKCIEEKGAREVCLKTPGNDKLNICVMLSARSDGKKLKPYVLLPRKKKILEIEKKFNNKLVLAWKDTHWFNDEITADYIQKLYGGLKFFGEQGRSLIVWDSYRAHISDSTKKVLKQLHLDSAVVPGGTTKFLQCADVVWNAPFKAHFRQQYEDWLLTEEPEITKGGNPKPPSMELYLEWIVEAWNKLPEVMIADSFKQCGITTAIDGSEDHLVHCLKADGPVPTGYQKLKDARMGQEVLALLEGLDTTENDESNLDFDAPLEFID